MASSNPAPTDTITSTTPAGAAEAMMPITVTHLILIAVAIALTILMILWGQRLWRRRRAGEDALAERNDTTEVGAAPVEPDADTHDRPAATADIVQPPLEPPIPIEPPAPAPVAPAPPPIAETLPGTPATTAAAPRDDLTILKGLGPKAATTLNTHGITGIAALAALTDEQAAALDAELGAFKGRMARDRWHEQARLLAEGDRDRYEATFGKLGTN